MSFDGLETSPKSVVGVPGLTDAVRDGAAKAAAALQPVRTGALQAVAIRLRSVTTVCGPQVVVRGSGAMRQPAHRSRVIPSAMPTCRPLLQSVGFSVAFDVPVNVAGRRKTPDLHIEGNGPANDFYIEHE